MATSGLVKAGILAAEVLEVDTYGLLLGVLGHSKVFEYLKQSPDRLAAISGL